MDKTKLTKEQLESIAVLNTRWPLVGEPQPEICGNGAVMVECFYSAATEANGGSMWIGIEPDGYRHS